MFKIIKYLHCSSSRLFSSKSTLNPTIPHNPLTSKKYKYSKKYREQLQYKESRKSLNDSYEKKSFNDSYEKKPFNDSPRTYEKKSFNDSPRTYEKKSFNDSPRTYEKKSFNDSPRTYEKKSFNDSPRTYEKKSFNDSPRTYEKKSFNDSPRTYEKKSFNDSYEKKPFNDSYEKKSFRGKTRPGIPLELKQQSETAKMNKRNNSAVAQSQSSFEYFQGLSEHTWFNDPYLISKHVKKLLINKGKVEQVTDLVYRHKESNPIVFATLIKGLSDLGLVAKAVKAYNRMKINKMEIPPNVYTSLFSAISHSMAVPGCGQDVKLQRLEEAEKLWNECPQITIYSVNSMLQVYYECAEIGGWKHAWQLFESLDQKLPAEDNEDVDVLSSIVPDNITYTIMIKLCAKAKTAEAAKCGIQILEEIQEKIEIQKNTKKKHDSSEDSSKKIGLDGPMVNSILRMFASSPDDKLAEKGIAFVHDHFGLPTTHEHSVTELKRSINLQILTLLVQLATRLKYPELGMQWFYLGKSNLGKPLREGSAMRLDEGVINSVVMLLMQSNQFENAYTFLEKRKQKFYWLMLRVCAAQSLNAAESKQKVIWERVQKIMLKFPFEEYKFKDILNFLEVTVALKEFDSGLKLVLERRKDIIDWTRNRFEKSFTKMAMTKTGDQTFSIDDRELGMDVKLLNLTNRICSSARKNPDEKLKVDLLKRQIDGNLEIYKAIKSNISK